MANLVLVDDSMIIRKVMNRLVSDNGHSVLAEGKNGNEAVDLYKEHKPDIVLLDLTMPNKGGKEALEEIIEFDKNAKIIIFSSVTNQGTKEECLKIGAKSFINKDIDFNNEEKRLLIVQEIEKVLAA